MENKPLISIVIAARNEEKYISRCLDSLVNQDYPKESMEIFVVDGGSNDKTKEIVNEYRQKYPFVKLLDNPNKVTPYAFNIGINNSKGEFIIIISAHGSAKRNYFLTCLKHMEDQKADIVGGVVKTIPTKDTLAAKSIALAFSHPLVLEMHIIELVF